MNSSTQKIKFAKKAASLQLGIRLLFWTTP